MSKHASEGSPPGLRKRQPRKVVDQEEEDDYAESRFSSSNEEDDEQVEDGSDENEDWTSLPSSPDGEEEEGESKQDHQDHSSEMKHVAEEDETPRQIAKKLGVNPKTLVEINKHFVPGLTQTAQLFAGTELWVDEASAMVHVRHHGYACDECGCDPIEGARYTRKVLNRLQGFRLLIVVVGAGQSPR